MRRHEFNDLDRPVVGLTSISTCVRIYGTGKKKVEAKYIISGNACIFCTRRTKAMHVKQCIDRLNGILGTKALHFYTRLK